MNQTALCRRNNKTVRRKLLTERVMGAGRSAPHLGKTIMAVLHSLVTDMFGEYRPERHYMRGPGPKWRAKHQPQIASRPARILSLRFAKASN